MSALITKREKQKRGFTMIELLAVLVILGIIMVIAVPSVVSYLQGARNDYYDQLEESVKTVGQEYFSDHRSLMPRENGQIFSVDIQDLITEGYTTEILDSDGNDTCTGNVYVKRLATADFEYHACIQCGKTDAEGNQEYISTSAFCTGGTTIEPGECDKVKDDPTDDCFMIQIPNSFKVPQCTTVEDSAASQGISLEGIVLNNGEDIGDRVTADTTSVDYKNIGNYKVYYTYKQVLNPAGEKYNFGVTIYDDKAPSDVTITMHTDSESGDVYNCPTRENCSWTGKDVYITFTATDKSDCGTEGSGVKQFMYRYGSSGNWQSVGATKTTINGEIAYTATVVRKTTFDGIIDVKAVDNAQVSGTSSNHESGTTRAYLLVDKTPPSCTSSGGSSDWINKSSNPGTITITGTCSDTNSGCREEKITKEYSTDIDSTTESPGTVYDNVGNSTVCPGNRTVKIDKTDPTCTSSGGSTNWVNNLSSNKKITLTGTCSDNLSGCQQEKITKTYTGNINSTIESPGTVYDNAGNFVTCPANQTVKIDLGNPTVPTVSLKSSNGSNVANGGSVVMQSITRTLSSTDDFSGINHYEWSSNCKDKSGNEDNKYLQSNNSHVLTISDTNNTANRACYRSVDNAGNVSAWTQMISFTIIKQQKWQYYYTGSVQSFTAPYSGRFLLEVWGAQGGNISFRGVSASGGQGGYSRGYVNLNAGQTIYIVVGGQGRTTTDNNAQSINAGGYNGGGYSGMAGDSRFGSGGGATHIATTNRGVLSNYNSYRGELLIVAGGGGGAGRWVHSSGSQFGNSANNGGAGGGLNGFNGSGNNYGDGGTQSGAGSGWHYPNNPADKYVTAGFGMGQNSPDGSGGGGGYYGGGTGIGYGSSAGGGSGYIGGVQSGSTINGGRTGNGYATISYGY